MAANTEVSLIVRLRDEATRGVKAIRQELRIFGSEVNTLTNKLAALGVSLGLGAVVRGAVRDFTDFDRKMREVNTLLGYSAEQFDVLTTRVLALSREMNIKPFEAADALYDIVSAGNDGEKALSRLAESAKLGIAGVSDSRNAFLALNAALTSFGDESTNAAEVADRLFATVEEGIITLPRISANFGKVSQDAAAAGLSLEESLAAMATASVAFSGQIEIATTRFGQFIREVQQKAPVARQVSEEFGLNLDFSATNLDEGLVQFIREVNTELDKLDQNTRSDVIGRLFGVEARGAFLAFSRNVDALEESLREIEASTGAVDMAFAEMEQSVGRRFENLTNTVSSGGIRMVEVFSGDLVKAANDGTTAVDRFFVGLTATGVALKNVGSDAVAGLKAMGSAALAAGAVIADVMNQIGQGAFFVFDHIVSAIRSGFSTIKAEAFDLIAAIAQKAQEGFQQIADSLPDSGVFDGLRDNAEDAAFALGNVAISMRTTSKESRIAAEEMGDRASAGLRGLVSVLGNIGINSENAKAAIASLKTEIESLGGRDSLTLSIVEDVENALAQFDRIAERQLGDLPSSGGVIKATAEIDTDNAVASVDKLKNAIEETRRQILEMTAAAESVALSDRIAAIRELERIEMESFQMRVAEGKATEEQFAEFRILTAQETASVIEQLEEESARRIAEQRRAAILESDNIRGGAGLAIEDYRRELTLGQEAFAQTTNGVNALRGALAQTFADGVTGARSFGDAIESMGKRIIDILVDVAAQMAAVAALRALFGFAGAAVGSLAGPGGTLAGGAIGAGAGTIASGAASSQAGLAPFSSARNAQPIIIQNHTNNISAVDTDSFARLVNSRPDAISGAMRYNIETSYGVQTALGG